MDEAGWACSGAGFSQASTLSNGSNPGTEEHAVSPFSKPDGASGYGGGSKPVGVKKWIEKYKKSVAKKKMKSNDEGIEINSEAEIIPTNEIEKEFESQRHNYTIHNPRELVPNMCKECSGQ